MVSATPRNTLLNIKHRSPCSRFTLLPLCKTSPSITVHATYTKHPTHSWTQKCTKVTDSIRNLMRMHFKATETFQYTNFYLCHPAGVTKGFIKGEALTFLSITIFKTHLQNRDYPARLVEKHLSQIKFSVREMSLAQKNKTASKKILLFFNTIPSSVD